MLGAPMAKCARLETFFREVKFFFQINLRVVSTSAFFLSQRSNHITLANYKKKIFFGKVKYSVIFPFFS